MAVITFIIANHTKQEMIAYLLVQISSTMVTELAPSPSGNNLRNFHRWMIDTSS